MNENQFTPGPWEIHEGNDYTHIYGGEYDHSENPLASVSSIDNAKLIAAAPDMLLALIEISEGKGRYDTDRLKHATNTIEDAIETAKAAIKKATEG